MNLRHEESADANSIRGVSSFNSSQSSVLSERVPSLDGNNMNLRHDESADANSLRGVSSHNSSQSSVVSERGVPSLDETTEIDAKQKTQREGFPLNLCSQIRHETADANREVSSWLVCNKIESNNMNLRHQESEDANSIRGVSSHSSSQSSVLSVRGVPSLDETTKPDAKRKVQRLGFPLSLRSQI